MSDDQHKIEVRDGMRVEWDAPIPMPDGTVLRADIFRPLDDGQYPVILHYGPYAKGLHFEDGYKSAWTRMIASFPEVLEGTSSVYQSWELCDPEKWVPDGYICLRIDSRGAGRSPGFLDPWGPQETQDLHDCIEWAGVQPWSNGKVGVSGISYYAVNQWQVGPLQPPHLAALCIWEGYSDFYREQLRSGGILNEFMGNWYTRQVVSMQHGVGERGKRSRVTGEPVGGPETLSEEELAKNRIDLMPLIREKKLVDQFHKDRSPSDFSKINVPLLSAANWGGVGLHTRGNFEGYLQAGTTQKWLEVHGDTHFSHFYSNYGLALQKKFFGHFLKGEDTGWEKQPPVQLNIRHPGEKFVLRDEQEWPLARTEWTKFYLDPATLTLTTTKPEAGAEALTYAAMGDGVYFTTPPLEEPLEITGPIAAKLFLSSQTKDADVFLAIRVYDEEDKEVVFIGSNDPRTPVGLGWLRASQRKLDPAKTLPYRPYHTHDETWPLEPGKPVELDVEVWPTCIVVPKGYRLALNIRGKDYEYDGTPADLPYNSYKMYGVGPFTHNDPVDRPMDIYGGEYTLHFGEGESYLMLPVIPAK
ncbi:MAG: CocE/NonD family hydrolase [Pseudomonadota bacterium]